MIKPEQLLPDIYYKDSRDFKLFSKLLEVVINSTDLNVKSMLNVFNPKLVKESFLDILSTAYNFYPKNNYSNDELRIILNNYNYLIKNRGSREGIQHAISLALRLNDSISDYDFNIINFPPSFNNDYSRSYIISILISEEVNINYLREFLDIVKPIGYAFDIELDVRTQAQYSSVESTVSLLGDGPTKRGKYEKGYVPEESQYGVDSIEETYIEIGREEILGEVDE